MPIYELGTDFTPSFPPEGEYWVAPTAVLIGRIALGRHASVWWNAVLRGDNELIEIGAGSNIQDGAVLHTDPGIKLTVGDGVTVGHKAMLHGCTIGDGALIGINSVILNHARIGAESLVGAGAVVTERKEFPDGVLILGAPARVVRELTQEERARLKLSAESYVRNWQRFATSMRER